MGVLFIGRKVDKGGQGEKVLATIELIVAVLNIGMHTAVNIYEMTETWPDKDEERTGYQILISVSSPLPYIAFLRGNHFTDFFDRSSEVPPQSERTLRS